MEIRIPFLQKSMFAFLRFFGASADAVVIGFLLGSGAVGHESP